MKPQRMTMFGLVGATAILLTAYVEECYANDPASTITGLWGPRYDNLVHVYVGIPFEAKPWAACYDSIGNDVAVYVTVSILSGELPPGLEIVGYSIVGVPTRTGTWHLRVAFSDLHCAGTYYEDRYQDLTIKAIGS